MKGSVVSLHVAEKSGAPMRRIDQAELVAGKGIAGDRYFDGTGTFSPEEQDPDHEVTLVAAEEIERFNAEVGLSLDAGDLRRNVVTRGVPLNDLVDVEFEVGATRLRGVRLCEPCKYLAETVTPKVLPALVRRSGLRAGIVSGGTIRPGDGVLWD